MMQDEDLPRAEAGAKETASGAATRERRRARRRRTKLPAGRLWYSTEAAAAKLDTEPPALRQRVRRCARMENGQVVARLGMGVVARKLGTTWRFYFGEDDSANAT